MAATLLSSDEFKAGFAGVPNCAVQKIRIKRDPSYGFTYEYSIMGLPESIQAFLNSYAPDQVLQTDQSGPFHSIVISTADDPAATTSGVFSNTFELLGNNSQKDFREHPKALALGQTTMDKIHRVLRIDLPSAGDLSGIGAVGSNARTVYDIMRQRDGNAHFFVSEFVFKVTTIISRRFAVIPAAYSGQDKLYTFNQLIAETDPTQRYIDGLRAVESLCVPASVPTGYAWSWLKQAPTLSTVADNREAVQNEYVLDIWSTFIYAAV